MTKPEEVRRSKRQMWSRIDILLSHVKDGELGDATVAFELLQSLFYARITGLDHDELQEVYPRAAWRERTITIPVELLVPLVDAWESYKSAPEGMKIGECLKIEGGGQGRHPQKTRLEKINKHIKYANAAVLEYYDPERKDRISWDDAMENVAEEYEVNPSTVRTAVRRYKKRIVGTLKRMGVLLVR